MLSVIIVDDKPLAIEILDGYLQKIPFAVCRGRFMNALEALDFIELYSPDLVLLDIQMPEITGVQLMKMAGGKSRYILVTAYPDYAMEGFDHNAIDYLLKPVSFDRFYQAMQKAKTLIEKNEQEPAAPIANTRDFIFIRTERRIKKIDFKDILFIEARQNYVEIHLAAEKIMALQTMKQTEDMLPQELFCRVHKSFIIHIPAIQSVEQHQAIIGKHTVPVGEAYRQEFYKRLGV
jgi:two-component system LytT family response regulator